MYVGPKKFVESDFVTRIAQKHSTTSEDGTVTLTTKAKAFCVAVGGVLGGAAVIAIAIVVNHVNSDSTDSIETAED